MRRLFLFLLLCLLSLPTSAQEDYLTPTLPDEPIFISNGTEIVHWAEAYHFAWIDNENLVFTFANMSVALSEAGSFRAYSYSLEMDTVTELDNSPFVITGNAEIRDFFRPANYAIHRSPFPNENGTIPILFESTLACDWHCFGVLVLYGYYRLDGGEQGSIQYPLTRPTNGGFNVHWSRNNNAVLMELGNNYTPDVSLSYVDLSTGEVIILPFYLINWDYDHAFGISADGGRIALATDQFYTENTDFSSELWQKLIIWDAPHHDDACACTYDPVSHVIYSETDNHGKNFVGVGFVDEDAILYIGNEGMFKHSISTGESTLIDAAFNTHWVNLAVFSPDNRHVAVTTEQGLYVLPTGFEG